MASWVVAVVHVGWLSVAVLYALSFVVFGSEGVRNGDLSVGEWLGDLAVAALVLTTAAAGLTAAVISGVRPNGRWLISGLLCTAVGVIAAVALFALDR
ncbi:hypothetical protein AB0M54_23880 [Actinoplanes sp. NPDC051470]|uniref:hypothetical protein n=1 Tax=unclassified Actinoplanes TaxID=2626549 RepID=UPI0034170C16